MPIRYGKDTCTALVFGVSVFASALLLFSLQPLVGKKLLPIFGGAPAVWNTCLVFFQSCLLLGYIYAHLQARYLPARVQLPLHMLVLGIGWSVLQISVPSHWSSAVFSNSARSLMVLLIPGIGLPFIALSATAPLLQVWYSRTHTDRVTDPYSLYAASNLGSFTGLLAYPLVLEPHWPLTLQARAWSLGYATTAVLIGLSALAIPHGNPQTVRSRPERTGRITAGTLVRWLIYGALPSSLLQSVTTHLTTDIAAVPLLWMIPLAVYLISFVIVFGRRGLIRHEVMTAGQPAVLVVLVLAIYWLGVRSILWLLPLNLIVLFVVSMVCHGELFRLRPREERLTEFYLCISVGGVLGGAFNAFVAPTVFTSIAEYPLGLVLAGLLIPGTRTNPRIPFQTVLDILLPAGLLLGLTAGLKTGKTHFPELLGSISIGAAISAGFMAYFFKGHSMRFGLGLAALIMGGAFSAAIMGTSQRVTVYAERNFFGVLNVNLNKELDRYELIHGTTIHGSQSRTPLWGREPSSYFFKEGPLGDFFQCLPEAPQGRRVAVAGLGAGALAAYAKHGDHWVFYEIDAGVIKLAKDSRFFTYLANCPARVEVITGDARLTLAEARQHYFDIIILDAFSSDSIPMHLLTREALATYLDKLRPNGVLLFQITNRYLGLEGVLRNLADDMKLAMIAGDTLFISKEQLEQGASPSTWVAMACERGVLRCLIGKPHWFGVHPTSDRHWSDDYSGILQCLKLWPEFGP